MVLPGACSKGKGLTVARSLVGNYCTSLDMAGCSITVTALDDESGASPGRAGPHPGAALVTPVILARGGAEA